MPAHKGRDLLLKIGDGGAPESFTTIGAARTTALSLDNTPIESTALDSAGARSYAATAAHQGLQLRLEGLFRDTAAEEALRSAAFSRALKSYELCFPNGDKYAAAFIITAYARSGTHDGLETFSVTLARSGDGLFTPGA